MRISVNKWHSAGYTRIPVVDPHDNIAQVWKKWAKGYDIIVYAYETDDPEPHDLIYEAKFPFKALGREYEIKTPIRSVEDLRRLEQIALVLFAHFPQCREKLEAVKSSVNELFNRRDEAGDEWTCIEEESLAYLVMYAAQLQQEEKQKQSQDFRNAVERRLREHNLN